ncbi:MULTISPECIES: hypothetical protein [unclassified Uliginosibacterium]|uniref:hypothetical protein n=1 Tax=unclassified Uliginosibacterium TaxID=2621521 RepID=UPI000C7C27B2|nr:MULTISPECIES: hypothetical protein [unclassified Uliginosibacterium]MDO6388073.1 hypothetical protein [Uliginosibacterium sp. 31-12]PLK48208.1 hypothetical protein C0V76_13325 [Uliginosibacterium sp. TH139]
MLLKKYEEAGHLFNANLFEACSDGKLEAYRGELILLEGAMLDTSGRRKPPLKVLQQAAMLADDSQLKFFTGMLDDVADVPTLLERYGKDMAADTLSVIFVVNINKPAIFDYYTSTVYLIPMDDGLPWSELMQLAGLEKADVKSLSSPDKIQAVYRELTSFRPRNAVSVALADVPALSNGKQREMRGAV